MNRYRRTLLECSGTRRCQIAKLTDRRLSAGYYQNAQVYARVGWGIDMIEERYGVFGKFTADVCILSVVAVVTLGSIAGCALFVNVIVESIPVFDRLTTLESLVRLAIYFGVTGVVHALLYRKWIRGLKDANKAAVEEYNRLADQHNRLLVIANDKMEYKKSTKPE